MLRPRCLLYAKRYGLMLIELLYYRDIRQATRIWLYNWIQRPQINTCSLTWQHSHYSLILHG